MKKDFIKPLIEVVEIDCDEIIVTSEQHYSGEEELPSDIDF